MIIYSYTWQRNVLSCYYTAHVDGNNNNYTLTCTCDAISCVSSHTGTGEAILSPHNISTCGKSFMTIIFAQITLINVFKTRKFTVNVLMKACDSPIGIALST